MTEQKNLLADIISLLDFGYATETCSIPTEKGEFRFELKTLSPLEEIEARQVVKQMSLQDEQSTNLHSAIELLARSITTLNGVPFENFPGAQGSTPLEKKKFVLAKLSDKVMVSLWVAYENTKAKTTLDGTPAEEEALKK